MHSYVLYNSLTWLHIIISHHFYLRVSNRSSNLLISFKVSIILSWKGKSSSCLDSFGNSKGKIGHYSEYKRFTFHALGFWIAFLMQSWTGEYRQGKKIILCPWSDVNIDKNKWNVTIDPCKDEGHMTKMSEQTLRCGCILLLFVINHWVPPLFRTCKISKCGFLAYFTIIVKVNLNCST